MRNNYRFGDILSDRRDYLLIILGYLRKGDYDQDREVRQDCYRVLSRRNFCIELFQVDRITCCQHITTLSFRCLREYIISCSDKIVFERGYHCQARGEFELSLSPVDWLLFQIGRDRNV